MEATHIIIEIALGNEASTDWDDVGWALDRVSKKIRNLWFEKPNDGDMLSMVDPNGNTIGWLKAIRKEDE